MRVAWCFREHSLHDLLLRCLPPDPTFYPISLSLSLRCLSQSIVDQVRKTSVGFRPNADLKTLPEHVRSYVEEKIALCKPHALHICDGSEEENEYLIQYMLREGMLVKLNKHENSYLARTDPADVARVESKTFICTSVGRRYTVSEKRCQGNPWKLDLPRKSKSCMGRALPRLYARSDNVRHSV